MARVFLSHAGKDGLAVPVRVRDWLIAGGHEVFLDCDSEGGMPSGGLWKEHLYERLRWASALVCVVTDAYIASQWCFGEIVAARVVGCPVVPLAAQAKIVHPLLEERQHIAIDGAAEPVGRQRLLAYLRDCDVPGAAGWPDDRSPFPGLRPFEPDMHQAFFGRQAETDAVMRLLRSAVERDDRYLLVVVGPSGCGKSSLVRAGVMAAISREAGWTVVPPATPGAHPLTGLARGFAQAMPGEAGWVTSLVRDRLTTDGLLDVATDYLTARPGPPATRLLLVIDQFEEVLTRADATGRQHLAKVLAPAVEAGVVQVVTTMRSEFLDPLLASDEFAELPIRSFPLRPLGPRMLPTVIEAPLRLAGIRAKPELVSQMVADTDSGESLPLLAYTLQQATTGMRRGDELTTHAYDTSGGVHGTLIRQADAALAEGAAAAGRSDAEVLRTLLRMVTIDETGHTSRRETAYHQFNDAAKAEIDTFVRYRLLTTHTDTDAPLNETVSVAVAHEAFLREWPPLAKVIESHRAALQMRVTIEDAATAWATSGHHRSYLWDRTRLANGIATLGAILRRPPIVRIAPRLIRTTGPTMVDSPIVDLGSQAVKFVTHSAQRNQKRRRRTTMTVAAVLAVSLVLTSIALRQWQEAVNQQHIATARELMARAEQLRGSDIYQALKLGLAAEQIDSNPSTRASLATTLASTMLTATMPDDQDVTAVAFSPDGHTLATTTSVPNIGDGGTVQLWDITNRNHPTRTASIPDSQNVTALAFSPDGHTLAATTTRDPEIGNGGTVQLWDVTNRNHPTRTASIPDDQNVTAVAFSPDGHTLVTTSDSGTTGSGTIQLWDVTSRTAPTRTATIPDDQDMTGRGFIAPTRSTAAFSPDGHTLVTTTEVGGGGGMVRLWDVIDPNVPTRTATITITDDDVTAAVFSPDGHTLVTTTSRHLNRGGTVQLWDVTNRNVPTRTATIPDNQDVTAAAFSPDGHILAATTSDPYLGRGGTAQLWDVTNRSVPTRTATIPDNQNVTAAAFSPDGHTLATATDDPSPGSGGTAQLWDVTNRSVPTRTATIPDNQNVTAAAFSPDGHTLVTATDDPSPGSGGTAQLWDVTNRNVPTRTATVPDDQDVTAVTFSLDGRTLAIATQGSVGGGTVQLWDVTNRTAPARTTIFPDYEFVTAVAFSPDGQTLAVTTRSSAGTVQLWDIASRTAPTRTATVPDDQYVTAVTFSPDGHTLATATRDPNTGSGTMQLWNVTSRTAPIRTATIPDDQNVTAVAFSPDGHTLAVTTTRDLNIGRGGTVQLWDVTNRAAPVRTATIPDDQNVTAVAFSPDGHTLVTTTNDPSPDSGGTMQLWDITNRDAPARTATIPDNQNVTAVAFGSDGHTLATATDDPNTGGGTMQLWDVEWITSLSGHIRSWSCNAAGGGLTVDEWSRSIPNIPFRQSC